MKQPVGVEEPTSEPSGSKPRAGDEIERQYLLERRLADRLRRAPSGERRRLYAEVYDELFAAFPALAGNSASSAQIGLELALLTPFLESDTRFVEFGAGGAELARRVAPRVGAAWAIDASVRPRDSEPANLTVLVRAAEALALPERSIDLAYSCHFVEHLHPADLEKHLEAVLNLLAPGGHYVCITPNRLLGPHDVSRHFDRVASGLHLREYTHGELATLFRRAGFDRVDILRPSGVARPRGVGAVYLLAERLSGLLPRALRLRLSTRREPFRPFEQVKICGRKDEA